jgi:hypothetical protein
MMVSVELTGLEFVADEEARQASVESRQRKTTRPVDGPGQL